MATVVAALAAAATAGVAGFAISLVFFAPLLVRGTPAPAPRPASELLLLAADVPRGPIPDTLGKAHLASAPAPAPAENGRIAVDVVPAALVRLKRIDLAAAIANAMVLPVAGALAIARLGPPGIWVAGGLVLTVDALVRLATKRSRAEIVRTVAVPALVRAEVCTTGTCGLASPQATWLMLVFGVACIAAARHEIIQSELASPAWVVFQWFTLTSVLLVWTVSRVRARHERLACVNVTAR